MPELWGTLSGLIDVMGAKLVKQVTEWPTGAQRLWLTLGATDWMMKFFRLPSLTCLSAQRLTPRWIQSRSDVFEFRAKKRKPRASSGKHSVSLSCLWLSRSVEEKERKAALWTSVKYQWEMNNLFHLASFGTHSDTPLFYPIVLFLHLTLVLLSPSFYRCGTCIAFLCSE